MTLLCVCVRADSRDDGKGKLKDRAHNAPPLPGEEETDFGRWKAQVACVSRNCGVREDDSPKVSLQCWCRARCCGALVQRE